MSLKTLRRLLLGIDAFLIALLLFTLLKDPYGLIHASAGQTDQPEELWQSVSIPPRKEFADYEKDMRGKGLFRASLAEAAPVAQRSLIDDYQFLGSSRSPSGPRAVVRNVISEKARTLAIGDRIGEYRLIEITPQGLLLDKDGERYELKR